MEERPVAPADTTGVLVDYQPRRRPLVISVIVLVLAVATVGVLKSVEHYLFRPEHTVTAFFRALGDRDAAAAREFFVPAEEEYDQTLLQPAVLKSPGYTPPADVRVERVGRTESESAATVVVSFLLGGQRNTLTLTLSRDEHATAGLFHQWRIIGGVYPIRVSAAGVDSVLMAGVPTKLAADGSGSTALLAALPGGYQATLPEQPLLEASPTVAYAGLTDQEDDYAPVRLETTLKSSARATIDQQVRSYLDECAMSTSLEPAGCPFSSLSYFGEVHNVHWEIVAYPGYIVNQDELGQIVVKGISNGEADVTGQEASPFGTDSYRDSQLFTLNGTVVVSGDNVIFQPPGD